MQSIDQSVCIDSGADSPSGAPALELRTGHLARFADAAVVASRGESAVSEFLRLKTLNLEALNEAAKEERVYFLVTSRGESAVS